MAMNGKIIFVVIGLLIGGAVGYLQRPEAAQIDIGPVQLEVQSEAPAEGSGPLTSDETTRILTYAVIGGALGLAIGFVVDRRKRT